MAAVEICPLGYHLTYERRCNVSAVKPIKIIEGTEVIIEVAVKNDPSNECWKDKPIVSIERMTVYSKKDDPQSPEIQILMSFSS